VDKDWKSHLKCLQGDIDQLWESSVDFFHGVIFVDGVSSPEISNLTPSFYAGNSNRIIRRILVPHVSGGCHLHYFYNDWSDGIDQRGLDALQKRLQTIHTILSKVPVRVLPNIAVPAMKNGIEENTIQWMYMLHWLASVPDNRVFHTEMEFSPFANEFVVDTRLKPWAECSTVPDFDPVPYLTLTASIKNPLEQWKQRFAEAGKQFPGVIASSLTKPVLYSSLNAIELLLQRDTSSGHRVRICRKKPLKSEGKSRELTSDETVVLAVLKKHHKCETDMTNREPLTNKEILEKITNEWTTLKPGHWGESRVQRTITGLFKSKLRYKRLCEQGQISVEILTLDHDLCFLASKYQSHVDPDSISSPKDSESDLSDF
jgi:hypothetical protein